MAKVKISGYQELIVIPNSDARKIMKVWKDDTYSAKTKITIGAVNVEKGEIKGVFLDIEDNRPDAHKKLYVDYYLKRDKMLELTPRERAEKTAWGHFGLFFQAIKGKRVSETPLLKEQVLEMATKFFEKNPLWAKPSVRCWYPLMPDISPATSMDGALFRLLEKIESTELVDIKENITYAKSREKEEVEIEDKSDARFGNMAKIDLKDDRGIKAEDIPF